MRILCGPKETKSTDLYLFHALGQFDSRSFVEKDTDWNPRHIQPTWNQLQQHFGHQWQPDILWAIHPEQRLIPGDFEMWPLRTLALANSSSEPTFDYQAMSSLFDYWIPISYPQQQRFKGLGLPVTDTIWMGYARPFHYIDPAIERLYAIAYFHPNLYSPWVPHYENSGLPVHYFVGIEEARNAFFLNQCRIVILDTLYTTARHFEAIASGCLLFCPAQTVDIQHYLVPEQHFIPFDADNLTELLTYWSQHPEQAQGIIAQAQQDIQPYEYAALVQKILMEISPLQEQIKKPPPTAKLCYWSQCDSPYAWALAAQILQKQPRSDAAYLNHLAYLYARGAGHKAVLNDCKTLQDTALSLLQNAAQQGNACAQVNTILLLWQMGRYDDVLQYLRQWSHLQRPALGQEAMLLPLPEVFLFQIDGYYTVDEAWIWCFKWLEAECLATMDQEAPHCQAIYESIYKEVALPLFGTTLARYLHRQGQYQSAREHYEKLLAGFPLCMQIWADYYQLVRLHPAGQPVKNLDFGLLMRFNSGFQHLELFYYLKRCLEPDIQENKPHVTWEGAFFSHHSMAQINRAIVKALLDSEEWHVTALPFEPPDFKPDWPSLPTDFCPVPVQAIVCHHWPPRWQPPHEGHWINIVPWEHGVIPAAWVPIINQQIDELWVPSAFVRDSFIRSGVAPERVQVIPNGVDTRLFQPDGSRYPIPTSKSFYFLFVGGSLKRKGVDILLEAYGNAFTASDDVALVIKDFGTRGLYMNLSYRQDIQQFKADPNYPEIVYLDQSDFDDSDMAALFRACDVYVHPYRGEGFGMPILEAMACGLPVIVPDAGPAPEFCSPEAAFWIHSWVRFEDARDVGGAGLSDYQPFWNEPDVEALSTLLRQAYENLNDLSNKGQAARLQALKYDWKHIAERVTQRLTAIMTTTVPLRWRNDQAQQLTRQALGYFQQQQLNDAEKWLQAALQLNPTAPLLWRNQVVLKLSQQAFNEAKTALCEAIQSGLNWQDARPTLAAFKQAQNHPPLLSLPRTYSWQTPCPIERPQLHSTPDWVCLSSAESAQIQIQSTVTWPSHEQPSGQIWRLLTLPAEALSPTPHMVWYPEHELLPFSKPPTWEYLPLMVDFEVFKPGQQPLVLDESRNCYVFMAVIDWHCDNGWDTLLQAYIQAFTGDAGVNLILKPLNLTCDEVANHLINWLQQQGHDPEAIPGLTLLQEDISAAAWPALLAGANCFVGVNTQGHGIWHLAALASGLTVISTGQWSFLKNPYSQTIREGDVEHLVWLMRASRQHHDPNTALAVREYLQPQHDLQQAWPKVQALLERYDLWENLFN